MAKLNFANKSVFGKQEEKNFNIEINDNSVIDIPIELIDIGENIRDMTTDQELEELGQTIREYGQIEPCIVHQEGERYVIEMGSRRYKACKLEDIPTLKCIVRPKFQSEKERIIIQAIENEHRRDMSSREREIYMAKLIDIGMSQTEIAKALHKNKGWVNEALKAYTNYQKDKDIFDNLNVEISTRTMADTAYLSKEELENAVAKAKQSDNTKKTFKEEVKKIKDEKKHMENEDIDENTESFNIFNNDDFSIDTSEMNESNDNIEDVMNLDIKYTVTVNNTEKKIKVNAITKFDDELSTLIKNEIRRYYLEKGYNIND